MAVDRRTPTVANFGPSISGSDYATAVNEEVGALWNRVPILLTNVGGSANAITADVSPDFDGYAAGQNWFLIPEEANTGPVTLSISEEDPRSVRLRDGSALSGGEIQADALLHLLDDGTNLRILSGEVNAALSLNAPMMTCVHRRAQGTAGGSATIGARATYPLNRLDIDEIAGASLNTTNNQITLPAGTYEVYAAATFYRSGNTALILRNVTAGADISPIARQTNYQNDSIDTGPVATLKGKFTLSGSTVLTLQYYVTGNNGGSSLLGAAINISSLEEMYGYIEFKKVA